MYRNIIQTDNQKTGTDRILNLGGQSTWTVLITDKLNGTDRQTDRHNDNLKLQGMEHYTITHFVDIPGQTG